MGTQKVSYELILLFGRKNAPLKQTGLTLVGIHPRKQKTCFMLSGGKYSAPAADRSVIHLIQLTAIKHIML